MRIPALLPFRSASFLSRLWGKGLARDSFGQEQGGNIARRGWERGCTTPGVSRFPTTLKGEALSSAFHREGRFDSKRAGDLSKVTQLVLRVHPSPWPPSLAAADPGSPLRPGRAPDPLRRLPAAPARWQPWSPPRRARRRGLCGRRRRARDGLAGGLAGDSTGGAAVGTQARGCRVHATKGKELLEAVQARRA